MPYITMMNSILEIKLINKRIFNTFNYYKNYAGNN